jgi:outer membrane protein
MRTIQRGSSVLNLKGEQNEMSRLLMRILLTVSLAPAFVFSQPSAPPAAAPSSTNIGPVKMAWVELERVILDCDEGKKMFEEIGAFIGSKNAELKAMQKELDALKEKLELIKDKMSEEKVIEKEEEIERKATEFQRFQQDTQKEINSKRDRATNFIGKKLGAVLEDVAKQKGLDSIQFRNPTQDGYINPSLIITEEVVSAYNQKYGGGSSKPPAAKKP